MQANPSDAEAVLDQGWITEELFETWQQQAALACEILNLRGVDAQLQVDVGILDAADLHYTDAPAILQLITYYAGTSEGIRIVRSSRLPDLLRVVEWIQSADNSSSRSA